MAYFPGTVIKADGRDFKSFLDGLFSFGDISITQLASATGLLPSTIQNWINRGWVGRSKSKGFSIDRVARVLIINALRPAMTLDKIAELLLYLNGDADDTADDTVSEKTLYILMCKSAFNKNLSPKTVDECVIDAMVGVDLKSAAANKRLYLALSVMTRATLSAGLIREIEKDFEKIASGWGKE